MPWVFIDFDQISMLFRKSIREKKVILAQQFNLALNTVVLPLSYFKNEHEVMPTVQNA